MNSLIIRTEVDNDHITYISGKIARQLRLLTMNGKHLTTEIQCNICRSIVEPHYYIVQRYYSHRTKIRWVEQATSESKRNMKTKVIWAKFEGQIKKILCR